MQAVMAKILAEDQSAAAMISSRGTPLSAAIDVAAARVE